VPVVVLEGWLKYANQRGEIESNLSTVIRVFIGKKNTKI